MNKIPTDARQPTTRRRVAPWVGLVVTFMATAVMAAGAQANPSVTITNHSGAGISNPFAIAAAPDGAIWFTNSGDNSIGRITPSGAVSNYPDTLDASSDLPRGITAGPDGEAALWFTTAGYPFTSNSIGRITTAGVISNYTSPGNISDPIGGITDGPNGESALWFTNETREGAPVWAPESSIGKITTAGTIDSYSGDGIAIPYGITASPQGQLWFTNDDESSNGDFSSVQSISPGGVLSAPITSSLISFPLGLAVGPDGALWVADAPGSITRIPAVGAIENFPAESQQNDSQPYEITPGPDGEEALWFTDANADVIGRIESTPPYKVTDYSGPGIDVPHGITVGPDGEDALWFTNYRGNTIGRVGLSTTKPQTIEFTTPAPLDAAVGGTYSPMAAASSGLPVTVTVDPSSASVCSISGGVVQYLSAGLCTLDANQAGDAGHEPAPQVQQSFAVVETPVVVVVPSPVPPVSGSVWYEVRVVGAGPPPTGSVEVSEQSNPFNNCSTGSLNSGFGYCSISQAASPSPGAKYDLCAEYPGGGNYSPAKTCIMVTASLAGPNQEASAGSDGVTAEEVGGSNGVDTITETQYEANPSGAYPTGALMAGGNFFDVQLSASSTVQFVVLKDCDAVTPTSSLDWWNPAIPGWEGVLSYVFHNGCLEATLGATSRPTVRELEGTVFGTTSARGFISGEAATAATGSAFEFTVRTVGGPTPVIAKKGKLPAGIKFHNDRDGSASLSGTPRGPRAIGSYPLSITATFGKGSSKTRLVQSFLLTVTSG